MDELLVGLALTATASAKADPGAEAAFAERAGFAFVSMSDHLHGSTPTFEPWTALTWALAKTTRVRVLTRVLGTPYRPPAVVAKMAETLDRLSGGRLILGLGGGYSDEEFRAFGLRVPTAREKVDGLDEAVRVMRGLWGEAAFTFDGARYRTEEAELQPKPSHAIPVWLGTYGPRALEVTGRLADGWIPSYGHAPGEKLPEMLGRIRDAAAAAGRDPDAVLAVFNAAVRVDDAARPSDDVLSGPPELIADRLRAVIDLGFGGVSFIPIGPGYEEQADRLAGEVVPRLRE